MKKVVYGFLFVTLMLSGCASQSGNGGGSSSSNDSELQDTVDSLTTENSRLKSENSELSQRIEDFETLFAGTSDTQEDSGSSSAGSFSGSFKYGEAADFTSHERVTVTEVKADDSVELMDANEGEHPVVVTAIVENTSDEPIDFNAQTFDLYDGNFELANFDASTYGNNIPNSIAGGKKATVIMYFSAKGNAPYSVTYGPATWDE